MGRGGSGDIEQEATKPSVGGITILFLGGGMIFLQAGRLRTQLGFSGADGAAELVGAAGAFTTAVDAFKAGKDFVAVHTFDE